MPSLKGWTGFFILAAVFIVAFECRRSRRNSHTMMGRVLITARCHACHGSTVATSILGSLESFGLFLRESHGIVVVVVVFEWQRLPIRSAASQGSSSNWFVRSRAGGGCGRFVSVHCRGWLSPIVWFLLGQGYWGPTFEVLLLVRICIAFVRRLAVTTAVVSLVVAAEKQ